MKELLNEIGITQSGYFSKGDTYVIDLEDSNEYSKIFSLLDKSDLVEEETDTSISNASVSNILYRSERYSLNLIADFENDAYKLVVVDLRGDN